MARRLLLLLLPLAAADVPMVREGLGMTSYSPIDTPAQNPWAAHCKAAKWNNGGKLVSSNNPGLISLLRPTHALARAPQTPRQKKLSGMAKELASQERWPQLNGTKLRFLWRWNGFMYNFARIEPLSVAAFIESVLRARPNDFVVDIGANQGTSGQSRSAQRYSMCFGYTSVLRTGFYTSLAARIAPSVRVAAVDMQPRCIDLVLCHLAANHVPHSPRVMTIDRYVAADDDAPVLQVPVRACDSMAAPTATAGRRPSGKLRGTQLRLNQVSDRRQSCS